jgi:hypothetical protein
MKKLRNLNKNTSLLNKLSDENKSLKPSEMIHEPSKSSAKSETVP